MYLTRMKKILLSDGVHETLVSDCDYDAVMQRNWHYGNTGYAVGNLAINKVKYSLPLHNYIAGHCIEPRKYMIDHINRNPLDNRRENLRIASKSLNCHNSVGPTKRSRSGLRGIMFHKASGLWHAVIRLDNKVYSLKYHKTPEAAHAAYMNKKREYFGELIA